MATEREIMFGKLPKNAYLYCIHCERAYPKKKFRVKKDKLFGDLQMCPYEECDGDAVMDAWEWDQIAMHHADYPEVPEEGKVYPMYDKNNKTPDDLKTGTNKKKSKKK